MSDEVIGLDSWSDILSLNFIDRRFRIAHRMINRHSCNPSFVTTLPTVSVCFFPERSKRYILPRHASSSGERAVGS